MARDAVQEILERVERPVAPSPEFSDALLRRLLAELEPDGRRSERRAVPWRPWLRFAELPLRLRIAVVILLALLLVGATAATYFAVRTWVSAGPRGIQFTSDFELAEVFRDDGRSFYPDFKLAPDGNSLYALRQPSSEGGELRPTVLLRLAGINGEGAEPEVVLDFAELTHPALWDAGADLSDAVVGTALHQSGDDVLAVADDGQIFLTAALWASGDELSDPARATSLLVVRPDGGRQKVLTLKELVETGRPDARDDELFSLSVAASAPDLLWVKLGDFPEPSTLEPADSFYQVRDPNGDGDWGDRTIQSLTVPPPISTADAEISQMVPESGRAGSVLVPLQTRRGDYLVYRLADGNGDGDALDDGEAELLYATALDVADFPLPILVARVVREDGEVRLREFVAARLSRTSRISRISEAGELTDIARAFRHLEEIAATPDGNIYVVDQEPGGAETGPAWVVYRLTPPDEELLAGTIGGEPTTTDTETTPSSAPAGVPRIAFARVRIDADFEEGEIFLVTADGSGLERLVPGKHNHAFCQSGDGTRMAYFSDEEAPREMFVYVANADGTEPRKITERPVGFGCPFSERRLPLLILGRGTTVVGHDLETGRERTLATSVDRLVFSASGREMLVVSGLDFSRLPPAGKETLELVNVDTGERRALDGPREEGSFLGAQWSNDGERIAYFVGPSPHPDRKPGRYDLYVRDLSADEAQFLRSFEGGPPSVSWSAGGGSLLVCVADGGKESACSGDSDRGPDGELWRVDAETGAAADVADGKLLFAGWHPSNESFAYADEAALYLVSPEGERRKLARAPDPGWPTGSWLGWSPAGSYIGLGDFSKRLGVVHVETGDVRILLTEEKEGEFFAYRTWWR